MTASQALARYTDSRDADAFGELVRQYQRLVYSAASRRLARPEDVEDVTQHTFLQLARSANSIQRDLPMWLYTTAVNAANDLIRRDRSRQRVEALAAAGDTVLPDTQRAELEALQRCVDEAVLRLPADERALIVDHFFAGQSQRDIADALGVSQPTVGRQIKSAVDHLRRLMADAGYAPAALPLPVGLAGLSLPTVPTVMTGKLMKIGVASAAGRPVAVSGISWLIKLVVGAAVAGVVATGVWLAFPSSGPTAVAATAPAATQPVDPNDWRSAFLTAYALAPGENLRFIPAPDPFRRQAIQTLLFRWVSNGDQNALRQLPTRERYLLETEQNHSPMPFIQWRWVNSQIKRQWMSSGGPAGTGPAAVMSFCAGLDPTHIRLNGLPPMNLDGDWIVRDGASVDAVLADFKAILADHFKTALRFEKVETVKDAWVASGNYHLKRIAGTHGGVQIYGDTLDHPKDGDSIAGGGTSPPAEFWRMVEGTAGLPMVDETVGEPKQIGWMESRSAQSVKTDAQRQKVLDNLTAQTGVTFKRERRTFTQWVVTPQNAPSTSAAATEPFASPASGRRG